MQIDWITVSAQIVNFLVLAWLLHRFLYGPIVRAMERREQRIAQRLSDAERKREEAENEVRAFHEQQQALEARREQLLEEARSAADVERRRLNDEARAEVAAQKQVWLDEMERQKAEFLRTIRQRAQEHFFTMAQRALGDLADAGLEEQMSRVFQARLAALDQTEKTRLAAAGHKAEEGAVVHSSFALSPDVQHGIAKTIQDEILEDLPVHFRHDPDVLCGIELRLGGQTVAWSLAGYLEALAAHIDQDVGDHAPRAD
jgi:F-type H+-transporting ATPase subunit b